MPLSESRPRSGIILPALKRLVPNLLLSCASVLAVVLALEVVLRVFWPHDRPFFADLFVEDPAVGPRHRPFRQARMPSEMGAVSVRTNSRGYRDREYAWDAPGGFRILGLGDSFAFGYGVEEEDTYLAHLERLLAGRHVEVINAGVAGMGPDEEARLLTADGPGLHPDLVLVGFFVGNDLSDVLTGPGRSRLQDGSPTQPDGFVERWYRPLRPGRILPRPLARSSPRRGMPIPFKGFLRRHSHAYRFLTGRIGRLRLIWQVRQDGPAVSFFSLFQQEAFCLKSYPPEFDDAWARTKARFREMKAWSDGHGAKLAVVLIPTEAQVYPDRWDAVRRRHQLRDEDFDLEKPQRITREFAAEAGIPVIDVLEALRRGREPSGERLYFRGDIHWTPRGHAVAADEILRQLRSLGLLPAS